MINTIWFQYKFNTITIDELFYEVRVGLVKMCTNHHFIYATSIFYELV